MDVFSREFQNAIPKLRKQILTAFGKGSTQGGFRSVWEHFEEVIDPILIEFLKHPPLSISDEDITVAKTKSVYPDIKTLHEGKLYAIDVKSGEDHIDPWYDIGRLDTYEEKHLEKYAGEFSVVVRWKGRSPTEVVNVYIEPTYRTVGYRQASDGALYRPYDGKLRPKSWTYFDQEKAHWNDLPEFSRALIASRNFRRKSYILEWYKAMDATQRKAVKEDLRAIDAGKAVETDKELLDGEGRDSDG